jgi:MraZ protein
MSTIEGKIDAKGRVSVPAAFRAAIIAQSGDTGDQPSIFIYSSFTEPTIEGGGPALYRTYSEMLNRLDPFSEEYESMSDALFGGGSILTFDAEGRVSLPEPLLAHAGIDKTLCFVGMGERFRIWKPETYAAYRPRARAKALENRNLLRSLASGPPGEVTR